MGKPDNKKRYLGLKVNEIYMLIGLGVIACIALSGLLLLMQINQNISKPVVNSQYSASQFRNQLPPTWTPEPTVFVPTATRRPTMTTVPTSTPWSVAEKKTERAIVIPSKTPSTESLPKVSLNSSNYPEMYGPSYLFADVEAYRNKRFSIKQYVIDIQNVTLNNEALYVIFLGTSIKSSFRGTPIVVIGIKNEYPYRSLSDNDIITVYGFGQGVIEINNAMGKTITAPLIFGEGYFKH